MFAPFVFSFGFYQIFKVKNKLPYFYAILGLLFGLKFLNGYEHATTLVISAFIPVVYFEFKDRSQKLLDLWRQAMWVLVAGLVGFAAAMLLNVMSLNSYYHSWSKSVHGVAARAEDRASFVTMQANVVVGFQATLPDVYEVLNNYFNLEAMKSGQYNPVKYMMLSVLNYLLLPAVSLPIVLRQPIGVVVQSIFAVGLAAYFCLRWLQRQKAGQGINNVRGVWASYWLGLVGAFSWLVVMPGHAYPHAHLNGIIFYMPFLIICYVIIGVFMARWLQAKGLYVKKR